LSKFRARLDKFANLPPVKDLKLEQRAFWDGEWAGRLEGMHKRSKNWRRWGEGFRLPALAAGAAVPALAPFSGLPVRIATASLAALAVTLNGAATLFHTDQRTVVNRRYEGMLLAEGWDFVLGVNPYAGVDGFEKFKKRVNNILEAYDTAYETSIYVSPASTQDQTPSHTAQPPRTRPVASQRRKRLPAENRRSSEEGERNPE
jgi:Protein of unknown function (DUF4231)